MTELGGAVSFAAEILLEDLVVGEGRLQDLERDVDVQIRIAGPVDERESAFAQELVDPVDRDVTAEKYVPLQSVPPLRFRGSRYVPLTAPKNRRVCVL
jgi:hypothetical protein